MGVVGTGRLGREHVRVLAGLDAVSFVGCYDRITERARRAAADNGASVYEDPDALMADVDAVSVVVSTCDHARYALAAMAMGKDVFVEKPIAASIEEAREMVAAEDTGRILQVGHSERFNGAFEKALPRIQTPSFIEVHRLASFSVRGTDISVVGDLMIHDLDLLNLILGRPPTDVRAKGAAVLTDGPDIVSARLEYESGCVANVTASRISVEPLRKIRLFSPSRYLSIDLKKGHAVEYRKSKSFDEGIKRLRDHKGDYESLRLSDFVEFESFTADSVEPLRKELEAFCHSVVTREAPPVTGRDGLAAVTLAQRIVDAVGDAKVG
jgi:predicted dehydrogenase